jgi:preprotein translocase subunit YajC
LIPLLVLILIIAFLSYAYKKYQESKYRELVDSISKQNHVRTFSNTSPAVESLDQDSLSDATTNTDTIIEEHDSDAIVHEAKMLVAQNSPDEAIEHLQWAIKAKPKVGINVWLYLLDILRQQNLKDAFEKYAFQMHQNFNVMTPLWEEREVPMVVAESLEEFPYIIKFLTAKWPNEKMIPYLEKLINDNRSGERSGFSQSVIEEILLLIVVLKARQYE